jgi:hypothetical protein
VTTYEFHTVRVAGDPDSILATDELDRLGSQGWMVAGIAPEHGSEKYVVVLQRAST